MTLEYPFVKSVAVVDEAISQVLGQQAQVGSFQSTTIGSQINVLTAQAEALSRSISVVEDADVAQELALQVQNQMRIENATGALMNGSLSLFAIPDMFELMKR